MPTPHNRLGFGYQVGFVRLLNRFPAQQPFELIDELLTFVGVQLAVDAGLITHYQHRRQTISEHQQRITEYLQHTPFGETEAKRLEAFVFEESCRLEQTAALESRSKSFLKSRTSCSRPIHGRPHHRRAAPGPANTSSSRLPPVFRRSLRGRWRTLLVVRTGKAVSRLQKIKANPSKASAEAMLSLTDKLAASRRPASS